MGRPRLPKGEAKGRIVPVRFKADDLRAMEAAAKAANETVTEWVRSTIHASSTAEKGELGHYLQVFVGGEVSLNTETMNQQTRANEQCLDTGGE